MTLDSDDAAGDGHWRPGDEWDGPNALPDDCGDTDSTDDHDSAGSDADAPTPRAPRKSASDEESSDDDATDAEPRLAD